MAATEDPTARAFPGITFGAREAVIALALALISWLVIPTALLAPVGRDTTSPTVVAVAFVATIIWEATLPAIAYWVAKRRGGGWAFLGLRSPLSVPGESSLSRLAGPVLGTLVTIWVALLVYQAIVSNLGLGFLKPKEQFEQDVVFSRLGLTLLAGLGIVIMAPLGEEILFRGAVFTGFRQAWGFWPAAVLAGLLFAAAHLQLGLMIPFTFVGIMLARLYQRTGSLYANMSVHFMFNLLNFSLLVFFRGHAP